MQLPVDQVSVRKRLAGGAAGVLPRCPLSEPPPRLLGLLSVRMGTGPTLHPSDSGLDAIAALPSGPQGPLVPRDGAQPPTPGPRAGTHGKAAMAASRVNTAVLGLAGPTHENGAGVGSRCLRQNSVGDRPGGEMPSGRSALEETKRQGVCPSM